MRVWLMKEVGSLRMLLKRSCKEAMHLIEKSVINMIWLLLPVFDGSIITIGPGGLLLVFPTHLPSPSFSFLWVELQNSE